jgi:predicted nucleotidyltransferase/HEPN domain-containing protein
MTLMTLPESWPASWPASWPEWKRAKLAAIAARIREEAPCADLILLFGSHARGDSVDDFRTGYRSDFDLLVVVEKAEAAEDHALWARVEKAIGPLAAPTPVSLIVHDVRAINQELRRGQFFFVEIVAQGVVLFDANRFTLARPKGATPEERLAIAQEYFDYWFGSAGEFYDTYRDDLGKGRFAKSAFELHQATERYFAAALLVFTGTKPTTHDLDKLSALVAPLHPLLAEPFPRAGEEDERLFKLLKRAYIEARYKRSYRVTADDLAVLGERVRDLSARVERACREGIAGIGAPAQGEAGGPGGAPA